MKLNSVFDFKRSYKSWLKHVKRQHIGDYAQAMEQAIGGEFKAFGILERELLYSYGLNDDGYLIDVGCGSGRLSHALAENFRGRYLGIDILDELLAYARKITPMPDWRFERAAGLTIPEADGVASMVCFFSVFTHLRHEESFEYLKEAKRVLAPHGTIVISFLEFRIPSHWSVFEGMQKAIGNRDRHLDIFMAREMFEVWGDRLGLEVLAFHDGDKPHIPLKKPLIVESSGQVYETAGALGQSIVVLRRKD